VNLLRDWALLCPCHLRLRVRCVHAPDRTGYAARGAAGDLGQLLGLADWCRALAYLYSSAVPRWAAAVTTVAAGGVAIARPDCDDFRAQRGYAVAAAGPHAVAAKRRAATIARVLTAAVLLLTVCGLASLLALGLRFRRSRGIERQQLKWLVYAAAMTLLVIIATQGFQRWQLGAILLFPVLASVPAAAGIAILRYRLYDIDRIINRTLVYGLLTVLLGAVYVGGVFTLGRLLNPITGESSLAVAASTLAVAALFQPARRRLQAVVDRRFNRRRYDAARTVETFSARLRDEIDLNTLSAELLAVVDQTMQPTGVSIWLRPSAETPRHR
jgi:hypothetical protein